MPVLRGVRYFELEVAGIPTTFHLHDGSDVMMGGGNRQQKRISQTCSQQKVQNFRV